jgi:hypothetical protein
MMAHAQRIRVRERQDELAAHLAVVLDDDIELAPMYCAGVCTRANRRETAVLRG